MHWATVTIIVFLVAGISPFELFCPSSSIFHSIKAFVLSFIAIFTFFSFTHGVSLFNSHVVAHFSSCSVHPCFILNFAIRSVRLFRFLLILLYMFKSVFVVSILDVDHYVTT